MNFEEPDKKLIHDLIEAKRDLYEINLKIENQIYKFCKMFYKNECKTYKFGDYILEEDPCNPGFFLNKKTFLKEKRIMRVIYKTIGGEPFGIERIEGYSVDLNIVLEGLYAQMKFDYEQWAKNKLYELDKETAVNILCLE